VPAEQVGGDGGRTRLMAAAVEFLAQRDDLVLERLTGPYRAAVWPPRAGLQPGVALGQVAPDELDHPPSGDAVVPGDLALAPALDQHRGDHQLRHPHRTLLDSGCERCPATGVHDVLNSDTASDTS
jgi:hypothetical protein